MNVFLVASLCSLKHLTINFDIYNFSTDNENALSWIFASKKLWTFVADCFQENCNKKKIMSTKKKRDNKWEEDKVFLTMCQEGYQ